MSNERGENRPEMVISEVVVVVLGWMPSMALAPSKGNVWMASESWRRAE